ncbi:YccF domain-containing protein [Yimella sp. cx-51]|uniref:YccF domain-containing protein n=1 Tax=Yimella sp. cx-51 TaxID=2770551 RepID=UPI00165D3053|nr:YccF domain-containing protein [Yimella sp. cx-51]MBC9957209.1 YccF domain-containing protein [Yimella sp. cx-51]MBD2758524.1 YccF domain-containing protein [Yimella sp. cx-573]QTH37144.1 YccF domain-containing protein [Yimella sp. cx-51]
MKTLLNIIWFVFAGFWLWLTYMIAGVIMCIFIVTIPFGIASFRLGNFAVWPFGRTVIDRPDAGTASAIGNVLWFIFAGIWLAFAHVATAFALAITIIGIPFAWANLKMIPAALVPLGKQIVKSDNNSQGYYQVPR